MNKSINILSEGRQKNYDVSLSIAVDQTLIINMENTQIAQRFIQTVDHEFISLQKQPFQSVFKDPQDILHYLTSSVNEIKIDGLELAHFKIKKMKKDFTAQLYEKDTKIALLNRNQRKFSLAFQQSLSKYKDERKKRTLPKQRSFQKIDNHPDNSHKSFFTLTNVTGNSAKISYLQNGNWQNFVNKFQILPDKTAKYFIKFNNKMIGLWIIAGFCTKNGMGNRHNYLHSESAYFCTCTQNHIFEAGLHKIENTIFGANDLLECAADLEKQKLSWSKNEQQFAVSDLPKEMRSKTLYFPILLTCEIREIEIFV